MLLKSNKNNFLLLPFVLMVIPSMVLGGIIKTVETQKKYTILGLGDSITEGGDTFKTYLYPLWEQLFTAGYNVEFIGPNTNKCQIGTIKNAGFGGKNIEFLERHIDSIYKKYPANIVVLHGGHNHFLQEKPILGIIAAHRSIIAKITAINPDVEILVAQVITSGKLPKYSYIPELNQHISLMVHQLRSEGQPVTIVNQAKGYDWKEDSVEDKVHPNDKGAKKMANKWFKSLVKILGKPPMSFHPKKVIYKQKDSVALQLHIFEPQGCEKEKKRSAIVFFFGGGWKVGSPLQFYKECAYYASKGMVAISAEYRIEYKHSTTVFESISDAKSAIRWIRKNASDYGIDPDRIAAAGASAGGYIAAASGTIEGFEEIGENLAISSKPNLLLLYYPVIDNGSESYGAMEIKNSYKEISPIHNINRQTPPCLLIVGTRDSVLPIEKAKLFQQLMVNEEVDCQLKLYKGYGHPIFYYRKGTPPSYFRILKDSDSFLHKKKYLLKN